MRLSNKNIALSSSEIAGLWATYMNDSLATCVLKHFLSTTEDSDVKPLIEMALSTSQDHQKTISALFKREKLAIPQGFTDNDVDLNAPKLFSDTFYQFYLKHMARGGITAYSTAFTLVSRSDARRFFTQCITSSIKIYNKTVEVILSKGIYIRSLEFSLLEEVEFVKHKEFFAGWFADRRPANIIEITQFYSNIDTNYVGKSLIAGFMQVVRSKMVVDYMSKGVDISAKHLDIFMTLLTNDNIQASATWDAAVTNSITPPFSDKLMMFHTVALNIVGMANYGMSASLSMRHALQVNYARIIAEVALYAENGVKIMVDNRWFEQSPLPTNHKELAMERIR